MSHTITYIMKTLINDKTSNRLIRVLYKYTMFECNNNNENM